jgi:hypothetical protein
LIKSCVGGKFENDGREEGKWKKKPTGKKLATTIMITITMHRGNSRRERCLPTAHYDVAFCPRARYVKSATSVVFHPAPAANNTNVMCVTT